jgi:hypothetical protein
VATRRERVVLELEDRFTAELAKAAAAARLFDKELSGVNTRSGPEFSRTAVTIERDSRNVGSAIDKLSGRLGILLKAGASLGPALIPITTALVPAMAGLTTQLGFAVAGAGTAILAFQGVGDALDAMSKAKINPTVKNLEEAHRKLEALSVPAFNFVLQLREMAPEFKKVRDAAAEGLFPGLSESLDEVESLLPKVASIVSEIATTSGELVNSAAESLAGPEWEDFFDFVEREARPALTRLGTSVGNVASGLADMWMAFDPLSDDFQDGMVSATEAFEQWAARLSETQGFAEFVAYIRETGPQAMETIGSIANALLQVAEAAAPLGGPVLHILEAIADVLAAIADSPIGTPIFTAISAMSALNLATTGYKKATETAFGASATKQVQGFSGSLLKVNSAQERATLSVGAFARAEEKRRASIAKGVGAVAVAGAGYAALESGIIGTNTAMGAAVGMMAGPWGAAAGASVGLLMDLTAASDDVEASLAKAMEALENASTFDEMRAAVDATGAAFRTLEDDVFHGTEWLTSPDVAKGLRSTKNAIEDLFGASDVEEARAPLVEIENQIFETEKAATALAIALGAVGEISTAGGTGGGMMTDLFPGLSSITQTTVAVEDMEAAARRAGPAMQSLGINKAFSDLNADEIQAVNDEILRMDSAPGRIMAVGEAVAALDDELLTTEESAKNLSDALSGILDPKIDLITARNDWQQFLQGLGEDLDTKTVTGKDGTTVEVPGSRSLFDGTEGALKNQEALIAGAQQIQEVLDAEAMSGASPERIAKVYKAHRKGLIDTAVQAGLSEDEVRKFIRRLGLIPELVPVVVETEGVPEAEAELERLTRPRNVKITVKGQGPLNPLDPLIYGPGGRDGDPKTAEALGGFYPKRYALGGLDRANAHAPEIAPAGAWRVWAEPETGGETYIPHANDHRRPAAKRYLEETASLFGGTVAWYASGGMVPSAAVPMSAGAAWDYDRLAAAMLRARPMYGDVHISGDPSEFRRALRQDAALAGSDGMRRP